MNLLRWWRAHPEHQPTILIFGGFAAILAVQLPLLLGADPRALKIPH